MQALQQEPTIEMAALKAGIDPKTARKYIKAKGKVEEKKRVHRTHKDTFEKRWPEIEAKLKITPGLQTPTILNFLIELYPTEFSLKNERSLFRRIKLWRVQHCDKNKIIFRQELFPGRQSQSDWTNMNKLKVTINGKQFNHLLFHYMLTYSRVESIMICFSESLETLTRGYEQGITETGGVAAEHRTDNLTAATQQMGNDRVFTERWSAVLKHYDAQPSRNNPGVSNENGSIEKSHHLLKNAIDQHLMLRQSRDFKTLEDYQAFLDKIIAKRNFPRKARIAEELKMLRPLPEKRFNETILLQGRVTTDSLIQILSVTYSVPSRMIGLWLKIIVSRDKIELDYGGTILHTLPRLEAGVFIDYRHIIDGLVKKPGAFESYQHRAHLYPNVTFRRVHDVLRESGSAYCNKRYLELLQLAKMYGEQDVTLALELLMETNIVPLKKEVLSIVEARKTPQTVTVIQPNLGDYDQLHSFARGQNIALQK